MAESWDSDHKPAQSDSSRQEERLTQPRIHEPGESAETRDLSDEQGDGDRANDLSSAAPQEEPEWSADELELLYQQALNAMEAVESDLNAASQMLSGQEADGDSDSEAGREAIAENGESSRESSPAATLPETGSPTESAADTDRAQDNANPATAPAPPSDDAHQDNSGLIANLAEEEAGTTIGKTTVTPKQVIEAALFVGGSPLTAKKLCSLLRGEFDQEFVQRCLDRLNQQYADESRPYEIRMSQGGYRLVLHPEFERVRRRVFGMGPREIKLSQEMLEVLSLVAYKQPISRQEIERLGKDNAAGILRQLLRRELIAIERDGGSPNEVKYRATQRFLQLFGLRDFDELPQAEELSLK